MVVVLCVLLATQSGLVLSNIDTDYGVSLTVEGGGTDLTGPHCPGTVRLVCEGVDLTLLRWRYNGDIDIDAGVFAPDLNVSDGIVHILPPPFVSVELTSVSQSNNPRLANFSSVLIANLSQLEQESVTDISCGDTSTLICTLPVDITIVEESTPEDPKINVSISQNASDVLLTVYWERQTAQGQGCTESSLALEHTVTLLRDGTNYTMTVNRNSCGVQCSVEFSVRSLQRDENYIVYLEGLNSGGESTTIHSGTIAAFVECSAPQPPLNGSIDNHLSSAPLGTAITYQCDLYPDDVRMAVCSNVTGRGEWVPDPAQLECEESNADLCSTVLLNELEHGSLTRADISNGLLIHAQCDNGYTLSGPNIITCTATEGWSADLEAIQCTVLPAVSSTVSSLVTGIAVGVSGGCLAIATVALVVIVIVIKCACSRYQRKGSSAAMHLSTLPSAGEKPSTKKVTEEEMGMYSTLNHPSVTPANKADSPAVVVYEEIGPPSSKPLSYADVSTHKEESGTLPKPWSPVNYVTVEGSTESAAPLPERKARDSYVDMASGVSALSELQAATVPDKGKLSATLSFGDVNKERRETTGTDIKDVKLKANKSYGMVEMQ